jgi:Carboxypeptidase regulatory-like domain
MRRSFSIHNSMLLLWMLLGSFTLRAQNVGSLQGQVTDPGGAFVIGARVSATDISSGIARTTQTDSSGEYIFPQLSPGTYKVEVFMNGFRRFAASKVSILVATPTSLDVRLEIGSVSEQVVVESAVPTLSFRAGRPAKPHENHLELRSGPPGAARSRTQWRSRGRDAV